MRTGSTQEFLRGDRVDAQLESSLHPSLSWLFRLVISTISTSFRPSESSLVDAAFENDCFRRAAQSLFKLQHEQRLLKRSLMKARSCSSPSSVFPSQVFVFEATVNSVSKIRWHFVEGGAICS
jgi:hypothetical protein